MLERGKLVQGSAPGPPAEAAAASDVKTSPREEILDRETPDRERRRKEAVYFPLERDCFDPRTLPFLL